MITVPSRNCASAMSADAAVNDHAAIEHLEGMFQTALAAEKAAERLQVEHIAFIRAENQAGISHHQKSSQAEERPGTFRHGSVRQNEGGEECAEHPRIEPVAAPISRRRLARRSRTSKNMTAKANSNPAELVSFETLKGRK